MKDKKEEKAPKTKRPTAEKRNLQSKKRDAENKSFKARVRTAINAFKAAITAGSPTEISDKLSSVYSLADKGVKTGRFPKNKANRLKSRLTSKSEKE